MINKNEKFVITINRSWVAVAVLEIYRHLAI